MDWLYPALILGFGAIGWYSTFRLIGKYRTVRVPGRARWILIAFVVVSVVISFAASYFGFLSVRRVLGYPPMDWTPGVSVLVACIVFLLPPLLDRIADYIANEPIPDSALSGEIAGVHEVALRAEKSAETAAIASAEVAHRIENATKRIEADSATGKDTNATAHRIDDRIP